MEGLGDLGLVLDDVQSRVIPASIMEHLPAGFAESWDDETQEDADEEELLRAIAELQCAEEGLATDELDQKAVSMEHVDADHLSSTSNRLMSEDDVAGYAVPPAAAPAVADARQNRRVFAEVDNDLEFINLQRFPAAERLQQPELLARIAVYCHILFHSVVVKQETPDLPMPRLIGENSTFANSTRRLGNTTRICSTKRYFKIWIALCYAYDLIEEGRTATLRELYYRGPFFKNQIDVYNVVRDAAGLLNCSRRQLNVVASAKGLIAGLVRFQEHGNWIDCRTSTGHLIPSDMSIIGQIMSDARCIIVLEKETVFHKLAADRIWEQLPCILITGKGIPCESTRMLLSRLHHQFLFPVYGVFDYNPGGVKVLLTYRLGSSLMGLENRKLNVPMRWVGLRFKDVEQLPRHCFTALNDKGKEILAGLMQWEIFRNAKYAACGKELLAMAQMAMRVELDALHGIHSRYLCDLVVRKILNSDYL